MIVVDPMNHAVELHDHTRAGYLSEDDPIEHCAMPGFSYPVSELFSVLRRS